MDSGKRGRSRSELCEVHGVMGRAKRSSGEHCLCEDFWQWSENCVELTKSRRCNVHTYERGDGYMRTLAC